MSLDVSSVADVIAATSRWCSLVGDVRQRLRDVPDGSVQTCVTSPPYYGLRDYGDAAQIGQEASPREYVETMVGAMREVRRALADDGTLWLNLGDSYAKDKPSGPQGARASRTFTATGAYARSDLPSKNLLGIPWRVAFALQDDGWFLRSDIVWAKPNPMPESVTDRPTRAHEYVFLLTKNARYFYDADAIREAASADSHGGTGPNAGTKRAALQDVRSTTLGQTATALGLAGRNARSVWTIASQPYDGAHFATMPPELAGRCILAGSRKGDVVLDPFGGAATTALVALQHGRRAVLCELNPEYIALQRERLAVFDGDAVSPIRVASPNFGPLFGVQS